MLEEFPTRIRELRESLSLSVSKWAALLGVSEATAYFWESGRSAPASDIVERVVAGTGLPKATVALALGFTTPDRPLTVLQALVDMERRGEQLPRHRTPELSGQNPARAFGQALRRTGSRSGKGGPIPDTTSCFRRYPPNPRARDLTSHVLV